MVRASIWWHLGNCIIIHFHSCPAQPISRAPTALSMSLVTSHHPPAYSTHWVPMATGMKFYLPPCSTRPYMNCHLPATHRLRCGTPTTLVWLPSFLFCFFFLAAKSFYCFHLVQDLGEGSRVVKNGASWLQKGASGRSPGTRGAPPRPLGSRDS